MVDRRRGFPVLLSRDERRRYPGCPLSLPWDLVAPHEPQAMRNHDGQSLTTLARRGGLSPRELWHVLNDRDWPRILEFGSGKELVKEEKTREAVDFLNRLIARS